MLGGRLIWDEVVVKRGVGPDVVVGMRVFMLVSWSLGLGAEMALAGAAVAEYKMADCALLRYPSNEWGYELSLLLYLQ